MDAIKIFIILWLFIPTVLFGQKTLYPKDTIYVKYENKKGHKKWLGYYGYGNNKKKGHYLI